MLVQREPAAGVPVKTEARHRAALRQVESARLYIGIALLIVLLAALLRVYHLGNRSLWLDEVVTATARGYRSFHDLMVWTQADDQMPLLNTITWILGPLGAGEAFIRLPSAIAGTLTVPVMYFLGGSLFGRRAGLLAALLMAVMPFAISYSQEARPYAFMMLATSLQMYFAYQAVSHGRVWDWAGLAGSTLLNLYTHYLAIAATLGVCLFIVFAFGYQALILVRSRQVSPPPRPWLTKWLAGLATALVIVIGYLPWLGTLRSFLHRPNIGFGRYAGAHHAVTRADVFGLLGSFNLTGLVLASLAAGIVASVAWALRGQMEAAAVPMICLFAPLAALSLKLHGSLFLLLPRYLSFLFPAAILLAALGVESIALVTGVLLRWILPRLRIGPALSGVPPRLASVVSLALVIPVLLQLSPQVAASYQAPKDDYRGAAQLIISSSPPDSLVLAVGRYSNFVTISLGYYLEQRHSSITVVDGNKVDDRVAARLAKAQGQVWAAIFTSYAPNDLEHASTAGLQVNRFTGITVFRQASSDQPPLAEAESFLRWGSSFQPDLVASLELLRLLSGESQTVKQVVQTAGQWALGPGALAPGDGTVVLTPAGATANATFTLRTVGPAERLSLFFSYRNGALRGGQLVFVSAHDAGGQWLAVFPTGAGYGCGAAGAWSRGAFALTLPAGTTSIVVWLRASGTGAAEFKDVELKQTG